MGSTVPRGGETTELAVLLKAVPDSEALDVDLDHRRIARAPGTFRLNPFDARALQVARTLRRPPETLTAVCMGPPGAEVVLREALAAGVDRAILVSDPGLAGSDAQVTARVLARVLARVPVDLVVLGARSSDAETGQVPPELAALLDWPLITAARRAVREDADRFTVIADAREGWVEWAVEAPFVLSVGEKIAKPPKPTDEERRHAQDRPIEPWNLARLELAPSEVGDAGSPTVVRAVDGAAPDRTPTLFQDGTVAERVADAFAQLARTAGKGSPRPSGATRPSDVGGEAWIVALNDRGELEDAALPLLGAVRTALPRVLRTLVVGGPPPIPEILPEWGELGAQRVLVLPTPDGRPSAADAVDALRRAAGPAGPEWVLCVADPFGRELAGRWAAASRLGLIGDAMGLAGGSDGSVRWTKPAFGGQFEAAIAGRTRPTIATVRPGVFEARREVGPGPGPSVRTGPSMRTTGRSARRLAEGTEDDPRLGQLEGATRIVTVGMGIGGPDGIERLVPYLARWGAALGATRRVVDAGWLPVHRQVGLTGRSLAPELAVLLGVGKAQNHVIGLRRAGRLLAVNPDPSAPVFRYVDAGIVAGWEEALPALDASLTRPPPAPPTAPA